MPPRLRLERFGALTEIQLQALHLYAQGRSTTEVGAARGVSADTTKHTLSAIRRRVGAKNVRQLMFLYGVWSAWQAERVRMFDIIAKGVPDGSERPEADEPAGTAEL